MRLIVPSSKYTRPIGTLRSREFTEIRHTLDRGIRYKSLARRGLVWHFGLVFRRFLPLGFQFAERRSQEVAF